MWHFWLLHGGYYTSTRVLLHLLNELGERDKMRGLPSILSHFLNEFNKFNKTGARLLNYIYQMTKSYFKSHFWRTNAKILSYKRRSILWALRNVFKIFKPLVVYRFYSMALYHSKTRRHLLF